MPITEALISELDQEAAATRRLLERVPQDKLAWKPHEKSMPMGRLATHLAQLPGWGKLTLEQDEVEMAGFEPTVLGTVAGILGLFDNNVSEFREVLERTPDTEFTKTWTMKYQGKEVFAAPKMAVVRSMVMNHLVHHRGQLTVFLRLNDVLLPMTYGPSADESGAV